MEVFCDKIAKHEIGNWSNPSKFVTLNSFVCCLFWPGFLGAAYSKRWSKSVFFTFITVFARPWSKDDEKWGNASIFFLIPNTGRHKNAGLATATSVKQFPNVGGGDTGRVWEMLCDILSKQFPRWGNWEIA